MMLKDYWLQLQLFLLWEVSQANQSPQTVVHCLSCKMFPENVVLQLLYPAPRVMWELGRRISPRLCFHLLCVFCHGCCITAVPAALNPIISPCKIQSSGQAFQPVLRHVRWPAWKWGQSLSCAESLGNSYLTMSWKQETSWEVCQQSSEVTSFTGQGHSWSWKKSKHLEEI